MPATTLTYKNAAGATETAIAGSNGSGAKAPAAVLTDIEGAELKGQKARASSLPVALATEDAVLLADLVTGADLDAQNTLVGAVNETAPASDTASSGLNGRLQRIAQRLTALIALLPASIGQKAKAASLAVTLASDEDLLARIGEVQASPTSNTLLDRLKTIATALAGTLTTSAAQSGTWTVQPGNTANTTPWLIKEQRPATATTTSVNDTASSTTLLAANANRLGATIHNDSAAALYVKLGATASATDFTVKMVADSYYEVPFGYTGRIDGIWASDASGAARITELTA